MLMKIISGGQTGVDRAALDAAILAGLEHGGWCPNGRLAEDGIIPEKYKLQETASSVYRQRTKQNVLESDGTLILTFGELTGGSLTTLAFAEKFHRPALVLDLNGDREDNLLALTQWLKNNEIETMNVAGPREGRYIGIYSTTAGFMATAISMLREQY